MTGNFSYQMFQAERTRSLAEVRDADARLGQLAAAAVGVGHSVSRPARALSRLARRTSVGWATLLPRPASDHQPLEESL